MQFLQYEESTMHLLVEEDETVALEHEHVSERYLQQAPSSSSKVAYVIFEGREPGLWYNWWVISLFYFTSAHCQHLGVL